MRYLFNHVPVVNNATICSRILLFRSVNKSALISRYMRRVAAWTNVGCKWM